MKMGSGDVVADRQQLMKLQGASMADITAKLRAGNTEAVAVNANQISARDFITRAKPKTDAVIADVKRQAEAKFGKS